MRKEKTTKKEDKTRKEFKEFIKCINLRNIYVKNSVCKIDKNLFSKEKNEVSVKESFSTGVNQDNYFEVLCNFLVEIKNGKKIPVSINVIFCMEYNTTIKLKKELFPNLIHGHIKLTIIPYLREFVSGSSTRMGIPPIILPLYKVIPK